MDLVSAWRNLPEGAEAVLATVVRTSGSTYRSIGARMLISDRGWQAGSISGGCLETDLLSRVWTETAEGPALVTYDSTADSDIVWGFGLGCNGMVTVLLERLVHGSGPMPYLASAVEERKSYVLETVVSPGSRLGHVTAIQTEKSSMPEKGYRTDDDDAQILVEPILPPLPLVICGGGFDVSPLVDAAHALGWHVILVDKKKSSVTTSADVFVQCAPEDIIDNVPIDGSTAVVLMTHNYLQDLELLRVLVPSDAKYIGLLGPLKRKERLLQELPSKPTPSQLDKIHGPVGLNLGAEGPAEIALAVVAEILSKQKSRGLT